MKLDNKGFTGVEIVLVIVTVAALGFAGWTYYQNNNQPQQPAPIQTQTTTEEPEPKQEEKPQTTFEFVASSELDTKDFDIHPVSGSSALQEVELRITNNSETTKTYFARDFKMETANGELINVWDADDASIQFTKVELASGGSKTVSLKFNTEQSPTKLHWSTKQEDSRNQPIGQEEEPESQVIELEE